MLDAAWPGPGAAGCRIHTTLCGRIAPAVPAFKTSKMRR